MADTPTAPAAPPRKPSPAPPAPDEIADPGSDATDLIKKAASRKKLSPEEQSSALEWFLSDDPEEDGGIKTIQINVGTTKGERWIDWDIQPVDVETLRRIRRQVAGPRAQRRSAEGGGDEFKANLRVVVAGTASPDLAEIAQKKGMASPEMALEVRFTKKPGLLGQIAAEIMALSGYDEEDVREVAASGN